METRTAAITTTFSREKTTQLDAEASKQTLTLVASLSTHPLISVATAVLVLSLLYLPRCLLALLFSPISISTLLLLATLLNFGSSSARPGPQTHPPELDHRSNSEQEKKYQPLRPSLPCAAVLGFIQKPDVLLSEHQHFAEWSRRGSLEVIYEEYEEEEEEEEDMDSPGCRRSPDNGRRWGQKGLESMELCFCADDSDDEDTLSDCSRLSSPAWESPENLCFWWEIEEEELIEIPLEDNLFEIDLLACR